MQQCFLLDHCMSQTFVYNYHISSFSRSEASIKYLVLFIFPDESVKVVFSTSIVVMLSILSIHLDCLGQGIFIGIFDTQMSFYSSGIKVFFNFCCFLTLFSIGLSIQSTAFSSISFNLYSIILLFFHSSLLVLTWCLV